MFSPFHAESCTSERFRVLIPPTESDFLPLVAVLIEEMNSLGQMLLRAFQEYLDSGVCVRSMAITFPDSSRRETAPLVEH